MSAPPPNDFLTSCIKTKTLSAKDNSGKMIRHYIHRRPVGPADVHISITYSGICHSDIHTARDEWGSKQYPLCVGHEIMGVVKAVGGDVTKFKVGDYAGVGCFTDSCRNCENCEEGNEQFCLNGMEGTYGRGGKDEKKHPGGVTQGGYSSDIVVDENYVIRIPTKMYKPAAAPLLCAGITCFSPFMHHGIKKGVNLGIVGLGGLGHMGLKIGKALGAEVTVFSRTDAKREIAMSLGADKYVVSSDPEQMKAAKNTLHFLYNSIAADVNPKPYIDCLKARGTMIVVGAMPKGGMPRGTFDVIVGSKQIAGSLIGGIRETQEMIDFCAEHDVVSEIELIEATPEAVDEAWDRTVKGDIKFRFVIDTAATLKGPDEV